MPPYAYFHGQFMPLSEAKIGVMTNFLHYGTAVFEGVRGNWNPEQKQVFGFRLKEHYERLLNGCRVLKMKISYSNNDLCQITTELIARSGIQEDVYVRPLAYKSSEAMGVRLHNLEADFLSFVIPWGAYLESDKCRCAVSSWRRPNNNVAPPHVKVTGLYVNSAFAKTEAIENGFDEAIVLNENGYVSEGSGENIFLVIGGKLVTPSSYDSILLGITRDTVIRLAKNEMGIETVERHIDRTELYTCQECFFTGTAAHIAPIAEIDHRLVGDGEIGPVTRKLQELYSDVIRGNTSKYSEWRSPVYGNKSY